MASPAGALGSEYRETESFREVANRVAVYAEQFGAAETLLVVDIDNTLLAMREPLGSDQWFEWQSYLLDHEPDSPHLVADSFGDLLDVQGLLFERGRMRPPESDLPERIHQVQELGVATLVLTSRGDAFRPATERELAAAGYDFQKTTIPAPCAGPGTFAPYDAGDWAASGLTAEEADLFRLKTTPRPVSYSKGVLMVAGQHKGAMLLSILHNAKHTPKAVVYVDDHGRHVHRVFDALSRRGVETTVFHYHREDINVKRFRYGDKTEVTDRWRRIEASPEAEIDTEEPEPDPATTAG